MLKFLEIHVFLKLGVTSWYQSSSLSEPVALGVGHGLRLDMYCLRDLMFRTVWVECESRIKAYVYLMLYA